jgi:hypothetical protein
MKKAGTSLILLIHTVVLGVMFALASAGVYAHVPVNPDRDQSVTFDAPLYELDCCMMLAQGQRLHCDHAPLPLQATGPAQSDDNQPALIALSTFHPTPVAGMVSALTTTDVSITGPPAFILFGNFRS